MTKTITALLLGDIIGTSGSRALFIHLKDLIKKYKADIVVANGENASEGFGITPDLADQCFTHGVDVITTGNHIWQRREILSKMGETDRILRPENYPAGAPGKGHCLVPVKEWTVGVLNLQGRVRLSNVDCPFKTGKSIVKRLRNDTPIIIIDFHAESAEEKEALGYYLQGEVSAVVGTHTHVQTADERILSKGTAYMTDLGMIGPSASIIGFNPEVALQRVLTQLPIKMEVEESPARINGAAVVIDAETGRAVSIERIDLQSNY
jgi:hypothetical protein